MPRIPSTRIPQYVAQQRPSGFVRGAIPSAPDLSGLARGVGDMAEAASKVRERQELERERLADDEAKVAVTNRLSQAHADWTERLARAKQEAPEGAPGFTEGVLRDFDAWVEKAEQETPERGRQALRSGLTEFRSRMWAKAFEFETDARNNKVARDFETGLDADRRTVMADPSQFSDLLARRLALVRTLNVPPELKAKAAEVARERLANDAAVGLVDRNPEGFLARAGFAGAKTGKDGKPLASDPAAAAAAVKADPVLSQMKPEDLQRAVERATLLKVQRDAQAEALRERRAREAEAAANKREREANQAYTILSGWARDGIAADPAAAKPLLDKLAGTPYAQAYTEQAKQISARTAVGMLPVDVQRAQLDEVKAIRAAKGTSEGLEREIDARERILSAATRAYAEEPLRAGAERGALPAVAPLNTSTLDTLVSGLPARVEQAATVQGQTEGRRPVSPLLSQEAQRLGDMLNALPVAERGRRISELAASMQPGQAAALARQLDAKDRALALAFAAGARKTTQGRSVAELVAAGAQKMRDTKEPAAGSRGDLVRQQLRQEILDYVGEAIPGQARQDVVDMAIYINAGLEAVGSSEGAERAVRLAIGGDIVVHNGVKIPAPAGMPLAERIARVPKEQILAQTGANAALPTAGLVEPGNIDLAKRPIVKNKDGSVSTVRSMSVGVDGREYLIPTVSDDGRVMSDEEAITAFRKTGRHLGAFASPDAATAYAKRLHDQQAGRFVYAGGQAIPVDEFLAKLPAAQLMPAGYGRYTVRAGRALVTNAQREPIVVNLVGAEP